MPRIAQLFIPAWQPNGGARRRRQGWPSLRPRGWFRRRQATPLTVASTTPCSSPAGWTLGLRLVVVGSIALRHTPRVGQCSAIGCALVSAEHESMRQYGTPDLQTALHRAHEAVWIVAGMLGL